MKQLPWKELLNVRLDRGQVSDENAHLSHDGYSKATYDAINSEGGG